MMNNDKRIEWLDAAKGIGILSIMLVHMNALPFDTRYIATGYVSMFFAIAIGEYWLVAAFCRHAGGTLLSKAMAYLGRSSLRLMCTHMFVWVMV